MALDFDARVQAVITDVDGAASGGVITNEKPRITGRADPFATVDVHDGTVLLGVVTANGQGGWSLQLSAPLDDGIHDLSAIQLTDYGLNSTASYFAITVNAAQSVQSNHDNDSFISNEFATIDNRIENGSPYFPPNLFKSHSTLASGDTTSGDEARHDNSADSQSFVRQTTAPTYSAKGFDTVSFLGDHQTLDLSHFVGRASAAHEPAISSFDLGGHHNALKASLADVLSLGERDLFIDDGKQQLLVHGKEGDSVALTNSHVAGLVDGDWHHHGTAEVGGVLYNVVEHSSANTELLVEHAVRIELQ